MRLALIMSFTPAVAMLLSMLLHRCCGIGGDWIWMTWMHFVFPFVYILSMLYDNVREKRQHDLEYERDREKRENELAKGVLVH